MAEGISLAGGAAAGAGTRRRIGAGGLVLMATLAVFALHAARGFPTLPAMSGDNDSLMRTVEVRDLLAGQGWFDLHQFRMGPDGGFVMHWSRLVDAPLAALVLLGQAVGGSEAAGEFFARLVWPLALFAASLAASLRIVRLLSGAEAVIPGAIIAGTALHYIGIFSPGDIDHHNLQLLLTLVATWLLLEAPRRPLALAGGAGAACAAMLGVGMETAPYVAALGLFAAGRFLFCGEEAAGEAAGFGLGLAAAAGAIFAATIAPGAWGEGACDAFSAPQAIAALAGGIGIAAAAALPGLRRTFGRRLLALGLVGGASAALVGGFYPQCLNAPFAGLDPRLKALWLDAVAEAQPFSRMLRNDPISAVGSYATPFLAAVFWAWRCLRRGVDRGSALFGLMLGAAILVSLWQVRGTNFAIPLAAIALSGFVAERRAAAHRPGAGGKAAAAMACAWLASFPFAWAIAALLLAPAGVRDALGDGSPRGAAARCETEAVYGKLAALPPARILAVSNLGSPVLAFTGHRVLAGPYHRNAAGDLDALDTWMAPPDAAIDRIRADNVTLLAFCPGNPETDKLATDAPEGLAAALKAGRIPSWLSPVAESAGEPLRLFRVSPALPHGLRP